MRASLYIRILILFLALVSLAAIQGCADNAAGGDNLPPTVALYTPASNDTLLVQKKEVIYDASDDQGIAYVDIYVNDFFKERFNTPQYQTRPSVYWNMDSSLAGSFHSIYIVVTDISGNTTASAKKTNIFVTLTTDPPPAPYGLTMRRLTTTLVNISWKDDSPFAKGYELWKKTGFGGTYAKFRTLPAGSYNTNDVLADPDGEYYYKIRSYNDYGFSIFGEEVNTSGAGGSTLIIPPTKLTTKVFGTNKVVLTWQDNASNENYYGIDRKRDGAEFAQVGVVPFNSTTFTDSANGLQANQTYIYRIKAYSTTDSSWSGEKTITMSSFNLVRPSGFSAAQISAGRIRLSWTDNSNFEIRTYVERKVSAAGTYEVIGFAQTDITTFDDTTYTPNALLYYRLQTFDGNGYSEYSNEITFTAGNNPMILPDKKRKAGY